MWRVRSVQCAVCSVQCAVCSVQCAVCSVQCAVCSVQCAVCSVCVCLTTFSVGAVSCRVVSNTSVASAMSEFIAAVQRIITFSAAQCTQANPYVFYVIQN